MTNTVCIRFVGTDFRHRARSHFGVQTSRTLSNMPPFIPSDADTTRIHGVLSLMAHRDIILLRQVLPQFIRDEDREQDSSACFVFQTEEDSRDVCRSRLERVLSNLPDSELQAIRLVIPMLLLPPDVMPCGHDFVPTTSPRLLRKHAVQRMMLSACSYKCSVSGCEAPCRKLVETQTSNYTSHLRHRCWEHRLVTGQE